MGSSCFLKGKGKGSREQVVGKKGGKIITCG